MICYTCNGEGAINRHANLPDETCPECHGKGVTSRLADQELWVEDDALGSTITVRLIYAGTCLHLRRAVRDLNRGHIDIHSPYDCTGLCCFQGCKLIKVYKNYGGDFVGIVEIRKSYDV